MGGINAFVWATSLSRENRLYLLDVLEDMRDELQVNPQNPAIPLFRQVIRYSDLLPVDGLQTRDNYMKRRYNTAKLLEQHGIVRNVSVPRGQSGYDVHLRFSGDVHTIESLFALVKRTFASNSATAKVTPRERFSSYMQRLSVGLLIFSAGVTFSAAITTGTRWLWLVLLALIVVYVIATYVVPRWRPNLENTARWSEIGGFFLALITFIWIILHTTPGTQAPH